MKHKTGRTKIISRQKGVLRDDTDPVNRRSDVQESFTTGGRTGESVPEGRGRIITVLKKTLLYRQHNIDTTSTKLETTRDGVIEKKISEIVSMCVLKVGT